MKNTFVYKVPDGSGDVPDEQGRHTATVNVWHSAEQAKRFWGCEGCRPCVRSDAYAAEHGTRFWGWTALRGGDGDFEYSELVHLHDGPCPGYAGCPREVPS